MPAERSIRLQDLPAEDRPRERLMHAGERALATSELLAITLRSGHGETNALQLAQHLLVEFDGLPGLARASLTEMSQVYGMGATKAVSVKAAFELGRRLITTLPENRQYVSSPADAARLLMPEMALLEQEHLRAIFLDTRNRVLSTPTIYIGNVNGVHIRLGEIFRRGIRENAAALIVAHNHPSGDPEPSPEDIRVTRQMVQAGELLNMNVMDHIIIGQMGYVSLKERSLGFD